MVFGVRSQSTSQRGLGTDQSGFQTAFIAESEAVIYGSGQNACGWWDRLISREDLALAPAAWAHGVVMNYWTFALILAFPISRRNCPKRLSILKIAVRNDRLISGSA